MTVTSRLKGGLAAILYDSDLGAEGWADNGDLKAEGWDGCDFKGP